MTALLIRLALAGMGNCTKGSEFEPPLCPARLPAVVSVSIERLGARAYPEAEGQPPCAGFRPSRSQIIRYLSRARTTDAQSADATLDRSPYYASGTVHYANGRRGRSNNLASAR